MDLIAKNIVEIDNKKKARKNNTKGKIKNPKNISSTVKNTSKDSKKFSISSILINSIINEIKNDNEEEKLEEELIETIDEEQEDREENVVAGGYGSVSKHYGGAPSTAYVNYDKVWEHLGSFRSKSMYESDENTNEIAMKNGEGSREMVGGETQMMAARSFKYFARTVTMEAHSDYMTVTSVVPPVGTGVNSKDWEKYLLMMKMSIYQPIMRLNARMA